MATRPLEREECLRRAGTVPVGRVGVSVRAMPVVLPVNFIVDGDRVLIRTTPGTKFQAATCGAVVAFEADAVVDGKGWSVSIIGVARVVNDEAELARIDHLPLARWGPRAPDSVVAISADIVSGEEFDAAA